MRSSLCASALPQTRQTGRPPRGADMARLTLSMRSTIASQDRPAPDGTRDLSVNLHGRFCTVRAVNAFHVCGVILAVWAVIVSILGITRESFPSNEGAARIVGTVSVILVVAAIGTAIYTAATEEHEGGEGGHEEAAVPALPS
jgi:hypothetical protein